MNDFSDLENELKILRPAAVSDELTARVDRALAAPAPTFTPAAAVTRRKPARINWRLLGLGLAAAAALVLLAKVGNDQPPQDQQGIAALTPLPSRNPVPKNSAGEFVPTGVIQVVYRRRDEGLVFSDGSENPVRRVRYQKRETLQWRQAATGASLRVSYPSEEVVLVPVSGQ